MASPQRTSSTLYIHKTERIYLANVCPLGLHNIYTHIRLNIVEMDMVELFIVSRFRALGAADLQIIVYLNDIYINQAQMYNKKKEEEEVEKILI